MPTLYTAIMVEMGFGYLYLGFLGAIRQTVNSILTIFYGFATPFLRETRILAVGNLIMAFGMALSGIAGNFLGIRRRPRDC